MGASLVETPDVHRGLVAVGRAVPSAVPVSVISIAVSGGGVFAGERIPLPVLGGGVGVSGGMAVSVGCEVDVAVYAAGMIVRFDPRPG